MKALSPETFWEGFIIFKAYSVVSLYGGLAILASPDYSLPQKEILAIGLFTITAIAALLISRKYGVRLS